MVDNSSKNKLITTTPNLPTFYLKKALSLTNALQGLGIYILNIQRDSH